MKILIDGDSFRRFTVTENIAKQYEIECHIYCDICHDVEPTEIMQVHRVDKHSDSADFVILNKCTKKDIVITNDDGLASMVIALGAKALDQNGHIYTNREMSALLERRHILKSTRRKSGRKQLHHNFHRYSNNMSQHYQTSLTKLIESRLESETGDN